MTDESMQPYQRIADDVRRQIRSGRLKAGDRLPTTRELADQHDVAPGTVQRAFATLRADGLIYSHQGRGSFVSQQASSGDSAAAIPEVVRALEQRLAELTDRVDQLERKLQG